MKPIRFLTTCLLLVSIPCISDAQNRSKTLIPDLFTGVRLGSVLTEDGRILDTQAFNLYHLGR